MTRLNPTVSYALITRTGKLHAGPMTRAEARTVKRCAEGCRIARVRIVEVKR